jgi:hypothetical protein
MQQVDSLSFVQSTHSTALVTAAYGHLEAFPPTVMQFSFASPLLYGAVWQLPLRRQ